MYLAGAAYTRRNIEKQGQYSVVRELTIDKHKVRTRLTRSTQLVYFLVKIRSIIEIIVFARRLNQGSRSISPFVVWNTRSGCSILIVIKPEAIVTRPNKVDRVGVKIRVNQIRNANK